ncbi:MAG: hypothetical protein ACI4D6_00700 [Chordicoccus sp.]
MAKLKVHAVIVSILMIGSAILGGVNRQTYTDITSDSDFLHTFSVAEVPAAIAAEDCRFMKESLPKSSYILDIIPEDAPRSIFAGRQQKVKIESVYNGNDLAPGDMIWLTSAHWKIYPSEKTIDTGFVNDMKEGSSYLVFLSGQVGMTEDGEPVYAISSGDHMNAIFLRGSCNNTFYPTAGESTYVPYAEVKDNEFFAADQEGMDAYFALKNDMLDAYNS